VGKCPRFGTFCPFHRHRRVGLRTYSPMKMERTECSETLAFKLQTPGNNPKENIRQRIFSIACVIILVIYIHTTYHMLSYNCSLVTHISLKARGILHTFRSLFYVLQYYVAIVACFCTGCECSYCRSSPPCCYF
jgi:hypothetical protein